jgi:hypothetical protein
MALTESGGPFRTAKFLHLEYGKLKRLVQSTAPVPRTTAPTGLCGIGSASGGRSDGMRDRVGKGRAARYASGGKNLGAWATCS